MTNEDKPTKEYIELNAIVKIMGLATTGGKAKLLIRSGEVFVNGQSETRNRKKLITNDVVEYQGKKYIVDLSKL